MLRVGSPAPLHPETATAISNTRARRYLFSHQRGTLTLQASPIKPKLFLARNPVIAALSTPVGLVFAFTSPCVMPNHACSRSISLPKHRHPARFDAMNSRREHACPHRVWRTLRPSYSKVCGGFLYSHSLTTSPALLLAFAGVEFDKKPFVWNNVRRGEVTLHGAETAPRSSVFRSEAKLEPKQAIAVATYR